MWVQLMHKCTGFSQIPGLKTEVGGPRECLAGQGLSTARLWESGVGGGGPASSGQKTGVVFLITGPRPSY